MAEGAPLLREYGGNLIEGSNPFLSAIFIQRSKNHPNKSTNCHWRTQFALVGDIFEGHRLPRTSPHRFRDMIVSWAANAGLTTEQFRVVSMALGHADLSTTLTSYGKPTAEQSIRVMADLRRAMA